VLAFAGAVCLKVTATVLAFAGAVSLNVTATETMAVAKSRVIMRRIDLAHT
jgi:hypothetical protein